MERFWDIIEEININKVLRFLRDNIVSKYNFFFLSLHNSFRFFISFSDRRFSDIPFLDSG